MKALFNLWEQAGQDSGTLLFFSLLGLLAAGILLFFFRKIRHYLFLPDGRLVRRVISRFALPALAAAASIGLLVAVDSIALPQEDREVLGHALYITTIITISYLVISIISSLQILLLTYYDADEEKAELDFYGRRILTRFRILERIMVVIAFVIASALIMMSFQPVQKIGASLLASAGIVGVILGFAAQRSLGTLFAGIQLAVTQPIRLRDVVVVEGEWGKIEEIMLSYVVVRIWDQRRLVLPINYFIENPFENWTRNSSELLGTVFFYVDYDAPVQKIREGALRIIYRNPNWDGRFANLLVTNATETTLELRAMMSARDANRVWDLRCEVREAVVKMIQDHYPYCLPKHRIEGAQKTPFVAADELPDMPL